MGLEHTDQLLNYINNPHQKLTFIHIAGTNGKGSTAAHLNSILQECDYKVGLYTSPHLVSFNERIRINGEPVNNDYIISFLDSIQEKINTLESTFFEVTTAMAFNYFHANDVDIAIVETGLGGRLDSTNVIKPALTIMTTISMDHMDILGNNIVEIAKEKAGIIKRNIPLVTTNQKKNVLNVLKNTAKFKNASIRISEKPLNVKVNKEGTAFNIFNNDFFTPMLGMHQAENASLAITSLKHFKKNITNETIAKGLLNVYWPGRLQVIAKNIYYDVAHNEQSIRSVLKNLTLLFPNKNILGLFCIKSDKELFQAGYEMKNKFKTLFVTTSKTGLLMETKKLSKKLNEIGIDNKPIKCIGSGIRKIKKLITKNDIGLVFGSHYIAEELFYEVEISFDTGII
tara:strand:+ start:452 stop:1648 length:1197 start_codon:yes stop_codon:yes gene_type:complete